MKIAIGYNSSQSVWNFRENLIKALQKEGYDFVILAPFDAHTSKLEDIGCECINIPMRMVANPFLDLCTVFSLRRAMRRSRPDVYLGFTAKPNVYGTLAASSLGIPSINNIAGLGAAFISTSVVTRILKALYRVALSRSAHVFFQNTDDRDLFLSTGIIRHGRYDVLPGSGVDLDRFEFRPLPQITDERPFRFLMVSRLLWDKGVGEYVDAAKALSAHGRHYEFHILGQSAVDNPAAVPEDQLRKWVAEGVITHRRHIEDVTGELAATDCVVLPSYREGTPRSLLEAAAIGRPIVTTDAVGCRNTVDDGVSGLLCRPRDADDLADKLDQVAQMSLDKRQAMGRNGRMKMEIEFDETIVIDKYMEQIIAANDARKWERTVECGTVV